MKHPTLANWIRFKKVSENEYEIVDLLHEEKIQTDAYTVWFARQLNGKRNPYLIDKGKSKDDVDLLLGELEAENVIRDKRFFQNSFCFYLLRFGNLKLQKIFV